MRSAKPKRNAKSLRRSNTNVGSKLSGWNQKGQTQKVCGDNGQGLTFMEAADKVRVIVNRSVSCGVLKQCSEYGALEIPRLMICHDYFDPQRFGPGFDHRNRLGVTGL